MLILDAFHNHMFLSVTIDLGRFPSEHGNLRGATEYVLARCPLCVFRLPVKDAAGSFAQSIDLQRKKLRFLDLEAIRNFFNHGVLSHKVHCVQQNPTREVVATLSNEHLHELGPVVTQPRLDTPVPYWRELFGHVLCKLFEQLRVRDEQ